VLKKRDRRCSKSEMDGAQKARRDGAQKARWTVLKKRDGWRSKSEMNGAQKARWMVLKKRDEMAVKGRSLNKTTPRFSAFLRLASCITLNRPNRIPEAILHECGWD
jgi:hypothetical protein